MLLSYDINALTLKSVDQFLLACCYQFSGDWFDFLVSGRMIEADSTTMIPPQGSPHRSVTTPMVVNPNWMVQHRLTAQAPPVVSASSTTISTDSRILSEILAMVQRLYPAARGFKSIDQRDMLVSTWGALEVVRDFLFIRKTSAGKSAVFGLCALIERKSEHRQRVTVVICPLIVLCYDMKRQLQGMGIRVTVIRSASTTYSAVYGNEVVIMVPEVAAAPSMFAILRRLDNEHLLGAICCDEFHTYYTWSSIRPVMLEILQRCRVFVRSPRLMYEAVFCLLITTTSFCYYNILSVLLLH